nr:COMM domain-containing protein 10-like [Salvelinus alpinus]
MGACLRQLAAFRNEEERMFSEEEEQKLQSALSLDKQALCLVLHSRTACFELDKAVYHHVKPASLKQQFENIHLSPEKAEAFCRAWTTVGPDVVEKVWQRIFTPKKSVEIVFLEFSHQELLEFYKSGKEVRIRLSSNFTLSFN